MPPPTGVVTHSGIEKAKKTATRSHQPPDSNQLIKYIAENQLQVRPSRAKRTEKLAEYDEVIKYLYLFRGYTLDQLHEAMEIMFRIGATNKQYGGYVNRRGLKKKVMGEEWAKIAPYFYACQNANLKVAVRVNGFYTIEPSTVEKEIKRRTSASQEMVYLRQSQDIFESNQILSRSFDRVEAYIPLSQSLCQKIPVQILQQLPIIASEKALLKICHDEIEKRYGSGKELSGVANSGYFKYLRVLIYHLSNNLFEVYEVDELLDKIMSFGYRPYLKALLSLNVLSIQMAAENMLPFLVCRQDEELVDLIIKTHGRDSTSAVWYRMYKFPGDKSIISEHGGLDNNIKRYYSYAKPTPDLIKFIARGIVKYNVYARTVNDGVILLRLAIHCMLLEIETMFMLLPPLVSLDELDLRHFEICGATMLELSTGVDLQRRLDLGFRLNLHISMLKAIFQNDVDTVRTLLPYSQANDDNCGAEDLWNGYSGNECTWDRLGVKRFGVVVEAALEEISYTKIGGVAAFDDACLIDAAYRLQDTRLRDFLLSYFKSSFKKTRVSRTLKMVLQEILTDGSSGLGSLPCSLCLYFGKNSYKDEFGACAVLTSTKTEWCEWLIHNINMLSGSGSLDLDNEERTDPHKTDHPDYKICRYVDRLRVPLLHKTISLGKVGASYLLIRFGADVNHLDELGRSPLDVFLKRNCDLCLLQHSWDSSHSQNHLCSSICTGHKELLEHLLQLGARVGNRPVRHSYRELEPCFARALLESDIDFLVKAWKKRWLRQPTQSPPDSILLDIGRLCSDLVSWIQTPPRGPDRSSRIATTIAHIKSSGLGDGAISIEAISGHLETPLWGIRGISLVGTTQQSYHESYRRRYCFNSLQLLAIVAEPKLLTAAFSFRHSEAISQLRQNYSNGWSPLRLAVDRNSTVGNFDCIRILLDNAGDHPLKPELLEPGPYVDWCRHWNESILSLFSKLLWLSINQGSMEIFKCLIEHGAFSAAKCSIKRDGDTTDEPIITKRYNKNFVVRRAVELGRIDFLGLLLHIDIDSRYTARATAEKYDKKIMMDWIDQHWMGKSRLAPREASGYIETEQLGQSNDTHSFNPDHYLIQGMI
ncbi:hypothetical protein TWF481_009347 [Arthrobotrys musiformis]|uniref:Clr5 domain-containing protein n=1 Tax=Arthrobotrys musiformis TaxID=47236 RepID=A0AAV9W3H3_9PEZI